MATDPVYRMNVRPEKAAAKAVRAGQVYDFCSEICRREFTAEPQKYAGSTPPWRLTPTRPSVVVALGGMEETAMQEAIDR